MINYKSDSLTIEEQKKLLEHAKSYEDVVLFKLALQTGIRREDIVKIQLGNVNVTARSITFWEAKKKRFWTVPISKGLIMDIVRYKLSLPKGHKLLFGFTGRTAYNKLQKTLLNAGIKKHISFHDLRRSFVKTAKRQGLSDKAIQQITGDTQKVLQRHYENLDQDELKEEIDKL
ncbi:MAG: site-specific integrase [Candidatus Neomarinimicrobiota bacterium]